MKTSHYEDTCISIVGTGDYARALAKRLAKCGKKVLCGSRFPQNRIIAGRDPEIACMDITVVSIEKAVKASDVIFLALHSDHIEAALRGSQGFLQNKILVDVTNPHHVSKNTSHAEVLAKRYPDSYVVKAFNTISAYSLESDMDTGDKKVYIASDHKEASEKVATLARLMGYETMIYDSLIHAGKLEAMQRHLCGTWSVALLISVPVFIVWIVFATVRYHVERTAKWDNWPLHTLNKVMGLTSVTLLSFCYLPGCIASMIQLMRGTKHRCFPSWLDHWMRARKQLGLLALWLAAVHCILSVAHNTPAYFSIFYTKKNFVIPANHTGNVMVPFGSKMNWIGETTFTTGTFALATMAILGVTSLPSVGGRLNWCQWTFVQSYLGYICLMISTAHVILQSLPYTLGKPFSSTMKGVSSIGTILPFVTVCFRLILLLPIFSIPLYKIRRGWECCTLSNCDDHYTEKHDMEMKGNINNSNNIGETTIQDSENQKANIINGSLEGKSSHTVEMHELEAYGNPAMNNEQHQ